MSVIDEKWDYDGRWLRVVRDGEPYPEHWACADYGDSPEPRAKLAAQAPAMLRLLMKHEWHPHDEGREYCIECGGTKPYPEDRFPMGHVKGCALLAAINRATGVTS